MKLFLFSLYRHGSTGAPLPVESMSSSSLASRAGADLLPSLQQLHVLPESLDELFASYTLSEDPKSSEVKLSASRTKASHAASLSGAVSELLDGATVAGSSKSLALLFHDVPHTIAMFQQAQHSLIRMEPARLEHLLMTSLSSFILVWTF